MCISRLWGCIGGLTLFGSQQLLFEDYHHRSIVSAGKLFQSEPEATVDVIDASLSNPLRATRSTFGNWAVARGYPWKDCVTHTCRLNYRTFGRVPRLLARWGRAYVSCYGTIKKTTGPHLTMETRRKVRRLLESTSRSLSANLKSRFCSWNRLHTPP